MYALQPTLKHEMKAQRNSILHALPHMHCRQSRRNLHELLGFDPLTVTSPHQAGYGAGSGAPHVMFGYLKHLWATGDRKDALHRYVATIPNLTVTHSPQHH